MILYTTQEVLVHDLSTEGAELAEQGSHEARVWTALPLKGEGNGLSIPELKAAVGDESAKIGQGRAFKNGWIGKEGDKLVKLVRQTSSTTGDLAPNNRPAFVFVRLPAFTILREKNYSKYEIRAH